MPTIYDEMSNSSLKQPNKSLLSPSLNARRMKTDLKTSENVFLQSRSRSSSPVSPQKAIKTCETSKAVTRLREIRCDEVYFFLSPLKITLRLPKKSAADIAS